MTGKIRLDLPILLPSVPDASDACVVRLIAELQGRDGIEHAHVKAASDGAPARLCVHFDSAVVPLARIRELAEAAGARISERFGHVVWQAPGVRHERRARTVAERLRTLAGVLEAEASAAGVVRVEFDRAATDEARIREALAALGAAPPGDEAPGAVDRDRDRDRARVHAHDHGHGHARGHRSAHEHAHGHCAGHDHAHGGPFGPNSELIFSLCCGALLVLGVAVDGLAPGAPGWLPTALFVAAYPFGAAYTVREAIENLRLRRFEIDTLMLVAAAGAAALGAWAEGALLLFLFSLGHALEHFAMGRARKAIEALAELAPPTATVRRDGATREVPVEDLRPGDVVVVRPNARLAADGFVLVGTTTVDQAPVTGESIPVDKRPVPDAHAARARPDEVEPASRVFAGTINGAGAIEVEVTRPSGETALAKVVRMVGEAETRQSPTQRFTRRFERIFVPVVLGSVVLLLFAGVVIDEPFGDSFYRAMAVLVAASPCALAIATPSAVLSAVARAARGGVLVKGGAPLERLGALEAVAFDKTGTLTDGRPRITDLVPAEGIAEDELLAVAVAVESLGDHPLAVAIARDGRARLQGRALPEATDFASLTGRGVRARVGGEIVWIGKAEMFGRDGLGPPGPAIAAAIGALRRRGRTTMVVRRGDRDLGVVGLMDMPRAGAAEALGRLRRLGIRRMVMISGDHQAVADAVAGDLGLDEAWGGLMPDDKAEAIRRLRAQAEVAMVGDGVNDAPAMAHATVGIAMGAAGSDVALETADVALMADDLRHLPFAVGLGRRTRSIIRQNVVISLGVVALLVPATILGLGIGPAVALHEGSTLVVVFNALRLLAFRDEAG